MPFCLEMCGRVAHSSRFAMSGLFGRSTRSLEASPPASGRGHGDAVLPRAAECRPHRRDAEVLHRTHNFFVESSPAIKDQILRCWKDFSAIEIIHWFSPGTQAPVLGSGGLVRQISQRRLHNHQTCVASMIGAPFLPFTTSTRSTTSMFLSVQFQPICWFSSCRRREETMNSEAASVPKR
jgi:hypothetical protein